MKRYPTLFKKVTEKNQITSLVFLDLKSKEIFSLPDSICLLKVIKLE